MKDNIVGASTSVPTDQERLMALLALTVQELPQSTPEADASSADATENEFRRLDADPAALEAYLRRGMRKLSPKHAAMRWRDALQLVAAWLAPPRARFAAVAGVVLVISLVAILQLHTITLLNSVEQSYARTHIALPNNELILPWEHQSTAQGFTTMVGNDTLTGRAFANGLLRGRARLQGAAIPASPKQAAATERYVALGEWNVLLWSACVTSGDQSPDFWREQLSLAQSLTVAFAADNDQLVTTHLVTTEKMIVEMARQSEAREPGARNARRLAEELIRFREAYAPLQMGAVLSTP